MDTTTVQEIANQLGIAVDQVMEWLPAYAHACWLSYVIPIVMVVILLIISVITTIVFKVKNNKWDYIYDQTDNYWRLETKDKEKYLNEKTSHRKAARLVDFYEDAYIFSLITSGILVVIIVFAAFACIGPIIGWAEAPEMMLLTELCS